MTAIIKSASLGVAPTAVRSFGTRGSIRAPEPTSREELLVARVAELEAVIVRREEALPHQLAEARSAGAREALEERSDAEAQALKALKQALADAQTNWAQQLQSWEGLSIGIARAVLEQVFSNPADRPLRATSAIRSRLQILETSSVIRVRVSSEDFPDPDQLGSTGTELGSDVELVPDSKLRTGECVIDLKLGHADIGLPAQWGRISQLLDRLEREAVTP
jgi:flagellar biosynthesis/type III secretory pathway protein FliH